MLSGSEASLLRQEAQILGFAQDDNCKELLDTYSAHMTGIIAISTGEGSDPHVAP